MATTKRDRQRANREEKRRVQQKEQRRRSLVAAIRRWGTIALIVIGAGVVITLLVNRGDGEATETTTTGATTTTAGATTTSGATTTTAAAEFGPADYAGFRAQPVACGGDLPDPVTTMEFTAWEPATFSTTPIATIATSCGDLVVELDPALAPETVASFVFLAGEGYFDGIAFHRIVPGFMVQGGDPTATGTGSPGYRLPSEPPTGDAPYERGVIAMAGNAAGPNGSQFFILFEDYPLPPDYNVFGRLIDGFEALDAIEQVPIGLSPGGELSGPLETVYIEGVTVAVP